MIETTYHLTCDDCEAEETLDAGVEFGVLYAPSPKLHFTRVKILHVILQGGEILRVYIPGHGEYEELCGECANKVGRLPNHRDQ